MGFALVVIKEHAGGTVHLADDHPLGTIDDEGAVVGHQGHFAHVDFLFLDIQNRLGLGIFVHLENDQAQRYLQGRGIGHAPLLTFLDVVFGVFQIELDVVQLRRFGEILDRENRLEDAVHAVVAPVGFRNVGLQEFVVRAFLHLDQIGHRCDFRDASKRFADAFTTGKCQ